jgi:hypothetical protein
MPNSLCTFALAIIGAINERLGSLVPRPYYQLVGPGVRGIYNSVGVVMETHEIPSGESSSQVRVLE